MEPTGFDTGASVGLRSTLGTLREGAVGVVGMGRERLPVCYKEKNEDLLTTYRNT